MCLGTPRDLWLCGLQLRIDHRPSNAMDDMNASMAELREIGAESVFASIQNLDDLVIAMFAFGMTDVPLDLARTHCTTSLEIANLTSLGLRVPREVALAVDAAAV